MPTKIIENSLAEVPLPTPAHRRERARVGCGVCHGSFGELLQGQLPAGDATTGTDFLVTLPVSQIARAFFQIDASEPFVQVVPRDRTKSARLANRLIEELGLCGGFLVIQSDIAEGKGCASSSADMAATARAIGEAFDIAIEPVLIERLMLEIEPTDGVMYDECTVYQFRTSGLKCILGKLPQMVIAAIDELGAISTVEFDRTRRAYSREERGEYAQLLAEISEAVRAGDLAGIGRVATRSAELNQSRLPKRYLTELTGIAEDVGAAGVVAAHSGTWLGLILDPTAWSFRARLVAAFDQLSALDGDVTIFENLSIETACHPYP